MAIEGATVELVAALGGAAAAATLLGRSKWVVLPGFAVLAVAEILLGLSLVTRADLEPAFSSAPRLAAVALAAAALLAATFAFYRLPAWAPVALLVAAPFRIPVGFAGDDVLLLFPLYFVLGAAVLALVARVLAGAELRPIPLLFAGPAAAFALLAAVSLSWSTDTRNGTIALVFFLLPFSALAAVVARSPFERWTPRALATGLVSLVCAFTAVGLWQLRSGDLFFAPDLEVGNAYTTFFRVTSVFKDPSIYGRHLALGIVVLVVGLWLGRVGLLAGSALVAFVWTGLYFSYSQSSMVALAAGVLVVSLIAADARSRRVVLAATVAVVLLAVPVLLATGNDDSLRRLTSGRSALVENTVDVIREHPLVGVGIGAEALESRELARVNGDRAGKPSHTTPLTVTAELGALGVLAYLAFLAGGAVTLIRTYRRDHAIGLALAGAFLVL
ncbi:MAG TPA: O-antigen ligase family protein, partial [Gaiellaceae bacterium]|nr:O-antigen ligase family protein [Gaiellaceae bacterium]